MDNFTVVKDEELESLFKQFEESIKTIAMTSIENTTFTDLYSKLNGAILSIYMTLNSYYDERMYNYFEEINDIQKHIFQYMRKIRFKKSYQTMKIPSNSIIRNNTLNYTVSIDDIPDFDIFNMTNKLLSNEELQSMLNEILLKAHEFNLGMPPWQSAVTTLAEFIIDDNLFIKEKEYTTYKDYYDEWNKIKQLYEKTVLSISENNTFIEDSHMYTEDCLKTYQHKYQNIIDEDIEPINLKADMNEMKNTSVHFCKMMGQRVIATYNIATNQILFIISVFKNIANFLEEFENSL